ncbi:MAG: AraC family transcriptional regulator [Clostridia bacterium]|nr:AraC family transcriptional regulator [Clostridia bacterium]
MYRDNGGYQLVVPVSIAGINIEIRLNDVIRQDGSECAVSPHNHGAFQLKYIASGRALHVVDGEQIRTAQGNLLVIPPRSIHYETVDKNCSDLVQYSLFLHVKAPLDTAAESTRAAYERAVDFLTGIEVIKNASIFLPILESISREIRHKQDGFFNYLQGMCLALVVELLRFADEEHRLLGQEEIKYTDTWRRKLNSFFYDGYMNDIKLQDLADTINVSRRHASRIVFREYGVTYAKKLMEVRLEQAKYKLTHTDLDLRTISQVCGFQSCSYFTTAFKKNVGMTPTDYRASTSHSREAQSTPLLKK